MFLFILISSLVPLAAASPFDIPNLTSNGTVVTNATQGPMWSGDVPGHGYVELQGDAHDVLRQIFDLNPALRANELYQPDYNPYMELQQRPFNASEYDDTPFDEGYFYKGFADLYLKDKDVAGLASRGAVASHDMSADDGFTETHFYCGTFATGKFYDSYEAIAAVHTGQNGYWTIDAAKSQDPLKSTCVRLACSVENGQHTNTAVYWCNDNDHSVTAPASVLAGVAGMVASGYNLFGWGGCCLKSQWKGTNEQFSGQIFIGNGTNINVGWGDCSVPDYFSSPSQYAYPGKYGECS